MNIKKVNLIRWIHKTRLKTEENSGWPADNIFPKKHGAKMV